MSQLLSDEVVLAVPAEQSDKLFFDKKDKKGGKVGPSSDIQTQNA